MMDCGFAAICGRPRYHRGHHGGWRQTPTPIAPRPIMRALDDVEPGDPLTAKELQCVAEVIAHGNHGEAAECLGIGYQTMKNYIHRAEAKAGAGTVAQVALLLGWTAIPAGLTRHRGAA